MALPTRAESEALRAHGAQPGWWFRAKEEIVRDFLGTHVSSDATILVLGLGGGLTIQHLRQIAPRAKIGGVDIDPAAVEQARVIDPGGEYRVADLEHDPLAAAESVDLVIGLDILEHLEADRDCVSRAARSLRQEGLFVVNVPAHPWLFGPHDTHLGHRRRYRPREIEALIRRSGLQVEHSTPLFMVTLILLALWRPFTRLWKPAAGRSDVGRRFPWLVDRSLYVLARGEGQVAKVGLPFGSSHLVIARKRGTG